QAIGDARRLLSEEPAAVVASTPKRSLWSHAGWAVATLAIVGLVGVVWRGAGTSSVELPFVHLAVPLPGNTAPSYFALSPDGRLLVMAPPGKGLIVRALDSSDVR